MAGIFLSYRRADTTGWAGRLHDSLMRRLPGITIFMDVEEIPPGVKFADYIREAVASCDALIALIGPNWVTTAGSDGTRRLDDPGDFIRLEIASALERDVRVIPTLVGGAFMPDRNALPGPLKELCDRQNYEITDRAWEDSCNRLADALKMIVAGNGGPPPAGRAAGPLGRKYGVAAAGLAAVAAIGIAAWTLRPVQPVRLTGTGGDPPVVVVAPEPAQAAQEAKAAPPPPTPAPPAPAAVVIAPSIPAPPQEPSPPATRPPAALASPAAPPVADPDSAAPARAAKAGPTPRPPTESREAQAVPPSKATSDAVELAYWDTIKNSSDESDFEAYLDKYPKGRFVALARKRAGNWIADARGCKVENPQPKPNETITWSGACINGKAEGPGVYEEFRDGKKVVTIRGQLRNGRTYGVVTVDLADGTSYRGSVEKGKPVGRGVVRLPNGQIYDGEFRAGVPNGKGTRIEADERYVGDFVNGKPEGYGVATSTSKGFRYEGAFRSGKPNGRGTLTHANGNRISGNFVDGNPDGHFVIIAANGQRTERNFANGRLLPQ